LLSSKLKAPHFIAKKLNLTHANSIKLTVMSFILKKLIYMMRLTTDTSTGRRYVTLLLIPRIHLVCNNCMVEKFCVQ